MIETIGNYCMIFFAGWGFADCVKSLWNWAKGQN